jgi:hypothetical protein
MLAALSKAWGPNLVTAGQNIIMRRLGLVAEGHAPDATAFTEYAHLFVVGLSDEHCRAIRALFGDRWGANFHTCIVEDDEFLAAARELFPEEQGADGGRLDF